MVAPAAATQSQTRYTVKSGDSLWTIANRLDTSVTALKQANNLRSDLIFPKQVLVIPGTAVWGPPPAAAPAARTAPNPAPGRSGDRVQIILDYGRTLEGHPYRWGGTAPGGFDCSGFVYYVFGHHGISLPRTSYDMFGVGTPVSRAELRPGDLVFFTTYRAGASHVGIFYGNNMFLHGSSAGGAVIWTSLDTAYYSARFLGGRRVLP
jgi:cell wall-associated NlpC family hydrolase